MIVDLSPEVFAAIGVNPKHYPLVVVAGVLGLWATDVWLAIDELKTLAAKQRSDRLQAEDKAKAAAAAVVTGTADAAKKLE